MIDRPDWDEYFFAIAKDISQRSTCPSRKVGAVIVDPETRFIKATGFNGAPMGTAHCGEECLTRTSGSGYGKCKALHAELNAIIAAASAGVSTRGAQMYLTTTPCLFCSRPIINAGIKMVKALTLYPHNDALMLLTEGGVDIEIFDNQYVYLGDAQ